MTPLYTICVVKFCSLLISVCFALFETASHVAQASLKFLMSLRLALSLLLPPTTARVVGMRYHTHIYLPFRREPTDSALLSMFHEPLSPRLGRLSGPPVGNEGENSLWLAPVSHISYTESFYQE